MALAGANTYVGATTISGGTLQLGTGQSGQDGWIADTSGVTNNAMLAYNLYGNRSVAYVISGSGSLTKLGQGQLTLNGNNSYTVKTTVGGGVLNINGGDSSAAHGRQRRNALPQRQFPSGHGRQRQRLSTPTSPVPAQPSP